MTDQDMINMEVLEGKKSFKYLAKEINEQFDFKKVHKAMVATEWSWSFGKDSDGSDRYGIPTLETIKNTAYRLLKDVYVQGVGSVSTGGFTAGWYEGELYLTFHLEEASVTGIIKETDY